MRLAEYHRPVDLATVRRLLSRRPAVALLAGGSTLVPSLSSDTVVDLCDLPLDFADWQADGLHLGARLTLAELTPASAAGAWAGGLLARAAQAEGPINLRNVATIGGLVAVASGTSPLFLSLLAADAQAIIIAAEGPPQQVALRTLADAPAGYLSGHLLLEVVLPKRLAQARHGLAVVARTPRDEAIVAAVAVVEPDQAVATVVLGGVTAQPLVLSGLGEFTHDPDRLPAALADLLAGQAITVDFRGSADYRRRMAGVLARRALSEALASTQPAP